MGFCIFGPMLISVYEKPQKVKYIYVKQTKIKPRTKKIESVHQDISYEPDKNLQIKEDCIQCLRSLGMNKKDAKDRSSRCGKIKIIIP